MEVRDKVVVVTGAASGIGRAMAVRFAEEGAACVVCADLNGEGAEATAQQCREKGAQADSAQVDVAQDAQIAKLIDDTEAKRGPIALFCSNAGIGGAGDEDAPEEDWDRIWKINVTSHVSAARHLVPRMLERGGGYFLNTSSAAGLLTQLGSATYSVTKSAAVAFAEYLSIRYGDKGIGVSVLCPQAVRTAMTAPFHESGDHVAAVDGMMEPEQVAQEVVDTLRSEEFLVLPHKEVLTYMRRKTNDYDRWLGGMRRLRDRYEQAGG